MHRLWCTAGEDKLKCNGEDWMGLNWGMARVTLLHELHLARPFIHQGNMI